MKRDIKEVKEMLAALEILVVGCTQILKDGKIRFDDMAAFLNMIKQIETIRDGFVGIKEIPSEISDLQQEELIEIGLAVYGIVGKVKEEINKTV